MKLSELAYLIVKNVYYDDDATFTYDNFKKGKFDNSYFNKYIVNLYTPLNEAIARLNETNRLPLKVVEGVTATDRKITYPDDCKEIMSVGYDGIMVPFCDFGINKVKALEEYPTYDIEYKQDIYFKEGDYAYVYDDDGETLVSSTDKELKDYGINNTACQYIVEYCQGKLMSDSEAVLANVHITRAEQYFANIKPYYSSYNQMAVSRKFKVN